MRGVHRQASAAAAALCVIVIGRYDPGAATYAPPVPAAVSAIADREIILIRPQPPAAKPSVDSPARHTAKRRPG